MSSTRGPGPTIATILLVETQVELRYSIAGFLTRNGYQVLAAFDAADVLKVAKNPRPGIDLILLDQQVPQGSTDLTALLVQERPNTPVLRISGNELVEPVQLDGLLVRIRESLA